MSGVLNIPSSVGGIRSGHRLGAFKSHSDSRNPNCPATGQQAGRQAGTQARSVEFCSRTAPKRKVKNLR